MLIRRKVQTALAAVLLSAAVPGYVSAQLPGVTPDVIQKARQSGATEEQIQQALGGMSVPGTPQSGTNAGAGKSATGSADRKALDQKVLRDLNPTKVTGVDTLTWNQVLSNDWQLQQQQQRILQSMTTPYQDPEFEVLWEDGKFVRRPIPKVFGREIFQNKNLTFAPNYNMATPPSYVLGAGDEIVVEVWGPSELYDKQKITPDGTINIQGVGPISLNGLTIAEAQKRIASKLSGVMGGANVKVSLGQIRSIKVNIAGEVMVPGTYTLPSLATVFNAIYSAGGVNKIGSLRAIKVFRDGKEVATLDVYDYLINGKYDTNIRIEDNDMIIVQPYDSYVAVTGKVKRPRIYEMKKGETLAKAFEYAGGFTGDAYNDNVNVKRKTGRQYSILTVEKPDFDAFAVADGDSVSVGRIFNEYANRLVITGAVWRPGNYELTDNTATLSKLIAKAEGLKGNEFASRGQVTRRKSDYTYEVIPFNVREAAAGVNDIPLMREDSVYIPNILELREEYVIGVRGEVNRPDTLPFRDGMTVEDAILRSGGLKESASYAKIEVARRIKDPNSTSYTNKTADLYTFNIDKDLSIAPEASRFVLQPFDEVYVRRSPGYSEQQRVAVTGEVLYGGEYVLATAGERISDVIKKAGGFTPEAYVKGVSVKRKLTGDELAQVESMLKMARDSRNTTGRDSMAFENLEVQDFYAVGVDVAAAIQNPGGNDDIILRDGDQILVPKYTGTVKISGAVNYPNSVAYDKKNVKSYIAQAGWYKQSARRRPFVIYMNGKVASTRMGFFSRRYPKVEPGCEIVVPQKMERNGRGLQNVMGMMTSTASLAAMVASVINLAK